MKCPKCDQSNHVKCGIVKGRQRYYCKDCQYYYTVLEPQRGKSKEIKRNALELYLEGLGFRSIGRLLNVSHVAVYQWIRSYGEKIESLKSEKALSVVELDEMHSYVASKKTLVGSGLLLIDMGKNLSIAFLGQEDQKQGSDFGKS